MLPTCKGLIQGPPHRHSLFCPPQPLVIGDPSMSRFPVDEPRVVRTGQPHNDAPVVPAGHQTVASSINRASPPVSRSKNLKSHFDSESPHYGRALPEFLRFVPSASSWRGLLPAREPCAASISISTALWKWPVSAARSKLRLCAAAQFVQPRARTIPARRTGYKLHTGGTAWLWRLFSAACSGPENPRKYGVLVSHFSC